MRPGRETDTRIAKEIFGHKVWAQGKVLYESAAKGDRPLRAYTKEMEWAWEVVEHMKVTLIPIQSGEWFAFVGPVDKHGWESPQAVLEFLNSGNFNDCGAAVGTSAPLVICDAALKAVEKRVALAAEEMGRDGAQLSVVPTSSEAPQDPDSKNIH
jgi:hypothetical protein